MKKVIIYILGLFALVITQHDVLASQLVYEGINPNITPGAPYNPNQAAAAERTRPYNPRSITKSQTDGEIARRTVISTATSQLTSSSSTAGHIDFGDGSYADYSTVGGIRTVTITNIDGTSTTISFPI